MKMQKREFSNRGSVLHQARMVGKRVGDGRKGEEMKKKEKKPRKREQTE